MMRLLIALLCVLFWASGAEAQNAVVSSSPPTYTTGSTSLSQSTSGGLRVQPQDGAGNDVSASHPLPTSGSATISGPLPAGSNIIGQVGIDQTTPGTTNGVQVNAALPAGTNNIGKVDATGVTAIAPVVSGSLGNSLVIKNAAGRLYSVYASNLTGGTASNLLVINATSAPGDGAVTPLICVPFSGGVASANYQGIPPAAFSTGITAVVSSATSCFTKTTGVTTAFISGIQQ